MRATSEFKWQLAAPLLLLLAAITGAARTPQEDEQECFTVRFKERNMDALDARIAAASGLGPGAGQYMSHEELAELTGATNQDLAELHDTVAKLGGHVEHISLLRDQVHFCLHPQRVDQMMAAVAEPGNGTTKASQLHRRALQQMTMDLAKAEGSGDGARQAAVAAHLGDSLMPQIYYVSAKGGARRTLESLKGGDGRSLKTLKGGAQRSLETLKGRAPKGGALRSLKDASPDAATIDVKFPFHTFDPDKRPAGVQSQKRAAASTSGGVHWIEKSDAAGAKHSSSALVDGPPSSFPTPYGEVSLPLPETFALGNEDTQTRAVAALTLPTQISKSASELLNNLNLLNNIFFMSPCEVVANDFDAPDNSTYVTFSSTTNECAPSFSVTANVAYYNDAVPKGELPTEEVLTFLLDGSSPFLKTTTCGALKEVQLPAIRDYCARVDELLAANYFAFDESFVPTIADISDNTIIYELDLAAAIPATGVLGRAEVQVIFPPDSNVPDLGLSYSLNLNVISGVPASVRERYNAAASLGALNAGAKKLLGSTGGPAPFTFSFLPEDLAAAGGAFGVPVPPIVNSVSPAGPDMAHIPNNPENCFKYDYEDYGCVEAELDVQMLVEYGARAAGVTDFGIAATNPDFKGGPQEERHYDLYFSKLLDVKPPPDVFSWSFTFTSFPDSLIPNKPGDGNFKKAAAMGISIIVASGDAGANARFCEDFGGDYYDYDGVTGPEWPAASAWVTSVGSTMIVKKESGEVVEVGAMGDILPVSFSSGGGFGYPLTRGSWQGKEVLDYIKSQANEPNFPNNTQYIGSGRGYPDLALLGCSIPVQSGFFPQPIWGTSASAPMFAGFILEINAAIRATPGLEKQKLGYLNPFLYWAARNYPEAFNDITSGYNGSLFQLFSGICDVGFRATEGWDAVTGLGTPNIGVLKEAAIAYVKLQLAAGQPTPAPTPVPTDPGAVCEGGSGLFVIKTKYTGPVAIPQAVCSAYGYTLTKIKAKGGAAATAALKLCLAGSDPMAWIATAPGFATPAHCLYWDGATGKAVGVGTPNVGNQAVCTTSHAVLCSPLPAQ